MDINLSKGNKTITIKNPKGKNDEKIYNLQLKHFFLSGRCSGKM